MSDDGSYVEIVPDHCDRIVWRGRYYGLPYPHHAAALDEIKRLRGELAEQRQLRDHFGERAMHWEAKYQQERHRARLPDNIRKGLYHAWLRAKDTELRYVVGRVLEAIKDTPRVERSRDPE